jgi:hypothetical protein
MLGVAAVAGVVTDATPAELVLMLGTLAALLVLSFSDAAIRSK